MNSLTIIIELPNIILSKVKPNAPRADECLRMFRLILINTKPFFLKVRKRSEAKEIQPLSASFVHHLCEPSSSPRGCWGHGRRPGLQPIVYQGWKPTSSNHIISPAARLLLGIGSLLKKSCKPNNRAVQGTEDLAL